MKANNPLWLYEQNSVTSALVTAAAVRKVSGGGFQSVRWSVNGYEYIAWAQVSGRCFRRKVIFQETWLVLKLLAVSIRRYD